MIINIIKKINPIVNDKISGSPLFSIWHREFYANFYHTQCGNLVFYGHYRNSCLTCLCFYYACGNIRHTEYGNNSHTIDFHTVL